MRPRGEPGGTSQVLGTPPTMGERIRAGRKALSWNQNDLAERLGVTQPTVANWEAGVHAPRQVMLVKIAESLDVSLGWLAGGETPTEPGAEGPAASYVRRPLQHVPVLSARSAERAARGDLDPHEVATDYVPVTYDGGRLAAVFLPEGRAPDGVPPDSLLIVDYERREPELGDLTLLLTEAGLLARSWGTSGHTGEVVGTVVASIRFH